MAFDLHWINGSELVTKKQSRKHFRRSILDAWDWKCAYCGSCIRNAATLDHVIAQVNGGLTAKSNLVACCQRCNVSKGNKNVWEWFREQPFHSHRREAAVWLWHHMGEAFVDRAPGVDVLDVITS